MNAQVTTPTPPPLNTSFIDIHCHPALKTWLFNKRIYNRAHPTGLPFDADMFVNLSNMNQGGVNAIVSVYYLPEAQLTSGLNNFPVQGFLDLVFQLSGKKVKDIVEDQSTPNAAYTQIRKYIDTFVKDIGDAAAHGFPNIGVPRNFAEFEEMISQGKVVFLHSIEGAHCLGPPTGVMHQVLEDRLGELSQIGVCQFTLAHFFDNVLVSSQGGIPPNVRKLINYQLKNIYEKGYNETDNIAIRVVDKMLDLGIIIDLVHCHPGAKAMVYARNDARGIRKRPLVFSHTGVREVALKYNPELPWRDALYLPDQEDILKIKECGGVLGVIFMDYWLNGQEGVAKATGIILETIEYIRHICGNYENVSIGSDLDGFTEVPSDLAGENLMPSLIGKMKASGIGDPDIRKICFENYRRVLKNGWGKQSFFAKLGLSRLF